MPEQGTKPERVTILYSMRTGSGPTQMDTLDIDATVSLAHSLTAEVTQHPIESGSTVSDHVLLRPETVKLEGIISNAPIRTSLPTAPSEQEFKEGVEAGLYAHRAEDARFILESIWRLREPVTINAGLIYEDLVLQVLEFPQDAALGDAVRFSATFMRLRYAETRTVKAPKTDKPKGTNKGKRAAEKASAPLAERADSVAKSLVNPTPRPPSLHPLPSH